MVRSTGWDATTGELRRYQRGPGGDWQPASEATQVMLGRSGLGWGRGLHGGPLGEPAKREGDGRAPAGAFALGTAFGVAPSAPPGSKLPYLPVTSSVECVDDGASPRYNQLFNTSATARDWRSSEAMLRSDELYDLGVFVRHNDGPALAGGGSCIFLHVWQPGRTTSGCTSMARPALEALVGWLDPAARPVLVQLPAAEYAEVRARWRLP